MAGFFKNIKDNIKFKKGDIVAPDLLATNKILYDDNDFYIVTSYYAYYAKCQNEDFKNVEMKTVHLKSFDCKEVFMFGHWRVKVKNISTGKYKFFEQDDIVDIKTTYLSLIPGKIREIKLNCLL